MRSSYLLLPVLLLSCGPAHRPEMDTAAAQGPLGAWQVGSEVGYGVARLDTGNVLGANVFIGYGGYGITLQQSEAWVEALYAARLRALGVRTLYAVQGPADVGYAGLEIGNSRIAAALAEPSIPPAGFILVAAHSSGAFVAGELLQQLEQGADPFGVLGGILAYFNLDGGQKYVGRTGIQRLRRAYHVSAHLPASGQVAWNHATMASLGASYAAEGGFLDYDATGTGCSSGACLHVSLINTRPHSPSAGGGVDYTDFAGRPVNTWWLDARQEEAGLGLCATAFTLEEGLLERYAQLGGCRSPLGEPRSGASLTADGEGRVARFERGALQGRPGRGPYAVVEPVYGAWVVRGLEMGELGHPVADTVRVPGGVRGQFERGTLVVHDDGRVEQQGSADAGEAPADAGAPPQDLPGPVLGAGSPQPGDGEAAGGCSASGDGTGAWAAAAWGWVQWLWLRRGAPQWRRSRGTAGGR